MQVLIKLESMEKNKSKKKADLNKMFDIWGGEGEGGQYDELDDVDDHLDDDRKQIHNGIADLNKMYNIWGGKRKVICCSIFCVVFV